MKVIKKKFKRKLFEWNSFNCNCMTNWFITHYFNLHQNLKIISLNFHLLFLWPVDKLSNLNSWNHVSLKCYLWFNSFVCPILNKYYILNWSQSISLCFYFIEQYRKIKQYLGKVQKNAVFVQLFPWYFSWYLSPFFLFFFIF